MDPELVKKIKGNHLLPAFPERYQGTKKTELYRFGAQPTYLTNNMKTALQRHEEELRRDHEEQELMKK